MSFLHRLFGLYVPPPPVDLDPIEDPVFGRLVWARDCRQWNGRFPFSSGGEFELQVDAPSDTEHLPSDDQRKAFIAVRDRLLELRDKAIEDYLPIFNEEGVEGEPYTAAEMAKEVVPGHICASDDGSIAIAYYDTPSDLLGGHSLTITVSPDGKLDFGLEG